MEPVSPYWPATVPESLWQLNLLRTPEGRDFPFVEIEVSSEFVLAFLAGSVLICLFAWKRFAEPTYDVNASNFRDFQALDIWNLRDSSSLRRAYTIYCISLIFLYGCFAFFGRLIVQLSDALNVSGLQIGVGTLDFDSWRWPLLLALGISGFAPLINPLVPAELWLRRYAHEVVGIPTRIREKAIRIATLIDGRPAVRLRPIPDWIEDALHSTATGYLLLEQNLRIVVAWSYDENFEWSDPEIRRKLNDYERNLREETEAALEEFARLTNTEITLTAPRNTRGQTLVQLRKQLTDCVRKLEDCRDRFSFVIALYCEYGSRFERMQDSELKKGIKNRVVEKIEPPPTGLSLYWFVIVFAVYYLSIQNLWHPLIFPVQFSVKTVFASALFETFKTFLLLWLPLVGISTFATIVYGSDISEGRQSHRFVNWLIAMTFAALMLAILGMVATAFIYSALMSLNLAQMWQTLFKFGALSSFISIAPVAAICFVIVNLVRADSKRMATGRTVLWAAIAGGLSFIFLAVLVDQNPVLCKVVQGSNVEGIRIWGVFGLSGKQWNTCFTYYELLSLIMISTTVSLSVLGLAKLDMPKLKMWSAVRRSLVKIIVVGSFAVLLAPNPLYASPKKVVIGFRSDIPPFSFLPAQSQQNGARPFSGYLADLCYEIFANSQYQVTSVPINDPAERFDVIRRNAEQPSLGLTIDGEKVDVLCDAVTVRPDDSKRTNAGVFSPIVFVSGVSYLWRSLGNGDVEIGYFANSTAVQVAKEACTTDVLRLGPTSKCIEGNSVDCVVNRPATKPPDNEPTKSLEERAKQERSYILCPKASHTDLIMWFCSNTGPSKVYFGDREIILGKMAAWKAAGNPCDNVRDPFLSFTYEPYALLISKADAELFAFVQLRIYELFSHRSGAESLFYKWFPRQTMSVPSAWLFNLNAVMQADELLVGPRVFPGISPRPETGSK
ncbi:hypothetical protein [Rhizobium laguerreae]|uniref:hypothetical protein n=1 Tax=Rhizobium laguerreae TaxID=1076926 RepID=UPI001FEF84BC|nr:hypothetical protein [Rhizobium laguerreae]